MADGSSRLLSLLLDVSRHLEMVRYLSVQQNTICGCGKTQSLENSSDCTFSAKSPGSSRGKSTLENPHLAKATCRLEIYLLCLVVSFLCYTGKRIRVLTIVKDLPTTCACTSYEPIQREHGDWPLHLVRILWQWSHARLTLLLTGAELLRSSLGISTTVGSIVVMLSGA